MTAAIRCSDLTKIYRDEAGDEVHALRSASFAVGRGETFGLIGADGAGKTTTFKIFAGVMEATSGSVQVFDAPPRRSRSRVGYLTQPFSLYENLSVNENIRYVGGLRETPEELLAERTAHYLALFGMAAFADRLAGRLSGGMKQKLALTCALVSGPEILLLDEPTTGVDPVSRREFWDALGALADRGMTLVVATPYLDEAERCSRVACMDRGEILDIDSPRGLRSKLGLTRLAIQTDDLAATQRLLETAGGAQAEAHDVQRFGDFLDVMARDAERSEQALRSFLKQQGRPVTRCERSEPTLENAFVSILRERRGAIAVPDFPQRKAAAAPAAGERVGILAYGLHKSFNSFQAVRNVGIRIERGEIYGLLGANGAGKTTTVKMLCGLLQPDRGSIALLGHTKDLRSARVRSRIGYKSQKFALYDDLTLAQNLEFYAAIYGIPAAARRKRMAWALESAGLSGQENLLTGKLPGGWKQRIACAAAVMHEPDVVLLDEPTSGVDPLARRALWRMINDLADRGAAVLVVTHYLEEAEQCHRLGFMVSGEMAVEGTPTAIKAANDGGLVEVTASEPLRAIRELKRRLGEESVSLFGDRLHVFVRDAGSGARSVAQILAGAGIACKRLRPIPTGLEDLFIRLTYRRRERSRETA